MSENPPEHHDARTDGLVADLARRTAEVHVLQRVSSEINSTLELDEIFDIALRTMDELFEFHHANILLLEADGRTLTVRASRGYENQAIGGRVRLGTGVIGVVGEKRKLLHVNNLGQQRAYAAAQRRQLIRSGRGDEIGDIIPVPGLPNAESQIAIPLLVRDELIGVFSIESPVRRTFSDHDRELVTIVANQIASAVHNAQLYEERRRAAEALEAANASLEARVAERTAALERELRVAEELLSDARSRVEGPLLGESAPAQALRDAISRASAHDAPLLLVGSPGTGKEAVAHAIHRASGRSGAFIFVNCREFQTLNGSLSLDESDLSVETRPAAVRLQDKLELAHGGTLYLAGVNDLPMQVQSSLEAVLGTIGVRLIAASTRDLAEEVQRGRFEPRLYRLLSQHRIVVPALADRREDIPVLAEHFVRRYAKQLGKLVDSVSPESMRRLQSYPWPGNIGELRGVVERAVLVSRSTVLDIDEELLDEGLAAGSYRLMEPLGAGGMGEVWIGKHRLLARRAAVKLIRHDVKQGGSHDQLVRRFQREAQVTAGLRSPHTVQLYDFGVNETGSFYYVMELLDGLDLQRIVGRFGPQPAERIVMLLRQACRSLAEAHAYGLVHRDIKPANLFVTNLGSEYDYLKILDFGIVKDQPGKEATALTVHGFVQGTPAFMAPELVHGGGVIDGRADLYSLACTAYWALTGRHVFAGHAPAEMLLHHVQTPPVPVSRVADLPIPPALETIVMAGLEKDPAKRPASALELEARLAAVPFESPWTQARAEAWWRTYAPDAMVR